MMNAVLCPRPYSRLSQLTISPFLLIPSWSMACSRVSVTHSSKPRPVLAGRLAITARIISWGLFGIGGISVSIICIVCSPTSITWPPGSSRNPMEHTEEIAIRAVTSENWREALGLSVRPEQQRFISEYSPIAAIALAKAYVRPGGMIWAPYAIYADATMVGFFALAYEPDTTDQYWLFHFF